MMGLKEKDNQMDKTTTTNKNSRKQHNSKVRRGVNCLWIINKYCVKKEIKLMIQCMMLVFKLRTSWSSNKYCVKKEVKLMTMHDSCFQSAYLVELLGAGETGGT